MVDFEVLEETPLGIRDEAFSANEPSYICA